jgi:membrane protein YqaA with SNARE-associated domain
MSDSIESLKFQTPTEIGKILGKPAPRWGKTVLILLELILVLGLLVWWVGSESIRVNKSLWVLFFYCFPSEFLIAAVPHEPVIFYFAKFYSPLTVALISVAGTMLAEMLNYTFFRYIADMRVFNRMLDGKIVRKTVELFKKAPFLALCIAGFSPVPFYPFRFLVVLARYPIYKYVLALFVSRTPRFFLLALAARAIKLPDYFLVVLFIVLIAATNIPLLKKFGNKVRRRGRPSQSEP